MDEPLTEEELWDPENIFVEMMFYMYSMEPPLYYDLTNAQMKIDVSKLETLGPYARVMYEVLMCADIMNEKRDDTLKMGRQDGPNTSYGYFSKSFMTFRGVKMGDNQWIQDYKDKAGQDVCMPCTMSTSFKLDVGLEFTRCALEFSNKPGKSVLFVFLFQNYYE